jgi:hypothetical protein
MEPDSVYFVVENTHSNDWTPNGWPSESFVEMTQAKRLLVGFGTIDPQLEAYNMSADKDIIFSPADFEDPASVTFTSSHMIGSGCFFDPDTLAVSKVNNSWADVTLNSSSAVSGLQSVLDLATRLTNCGISPVLNRTLTGATADQDFRPYRQVVQDTIWSWGAGQPDDQPEPDADDTSASNRCAVLSAASGYWRTESCGASHYSACRALGQPYKWAIGHADTMYDNAGIACEDGTAFDVPRTALENRYLVHAWRNFREARDIDGDEFVWVNFNDFDVKGCWVIGQNATCPYQRDMDHERQVIVPIVAAVIVFVLAALTVFVKCAANRRRSKRRRRRGDDGWDYEGVPS